VIESRASPDAAGARAAEFARIILVVLAAGVVEIRLWEPFTSFSPVGAAGTLIGGWEVFRQSARSLWKRRMTMELSMAIAILAALSIGETVTALAILFFVLVAEVLEGLTVARGRMAIRELLEAGPRPTTVIRDGQSRVIDARSVEIGDRVEIKPGERIPADGVVVSGHSFVDQSSITGESLPVEKVPGAEVHAGTVNQSGALDVRVTRVGLDTTFGKIIEAVEQAERTRAPVQKTADRLSGYIVIFALASAALTLAITHDVRSAISVVIVAGACGVATGTPLAILGAIGRAARHGVVVKGGIHLETLASIDTVLLDKTGTLTYGEPRIVGLRPCPGVSDLILLGTAVIAERPSEHPLARAVMRRGHQELLTTARPDRFENLPGEGIVCSVGGEEIVVGSRRLLIDRRIAVGDFAPATEATSEVLVARGGRLLGLLRFEDVVRGEAPQAIQQLREMGIWTVLLSGDSRAVADRVGTALGVDEIGSELLPVRKQERVEELVAEGRKVAMIGDGINDAPALLKASVGVAMGSGADVTRESAGVVLLGDDLLKFVEVVRIARRCRSIILTNFSGTLLLDGVGVVLAALGYLSPVVAAFIHVASETAFVLNAARMGRRGRGGIEPASRSRR
jgi:Cd2+/Zn2+-exporting ATPase/Cu+-exporting ATPase